MITRRNISTLLFILLGISLNSYADIIKIKPKDPVAQKWTQYVEDLYKLHLKRMDNHEVEEKVRIGGYSSEPSFYDEYSYYDVATGNLLSRLQWERVNPENLHSIEVYTYKNGQIYKDYSASYLTKHRNAPIQTLNTIHYFNDDLHGFRSFDASNERLYEVCKGTFNGKKVRLSLDDDYGELSEALEDPEGIMSSELYKACFGKWNHNKEDLLLK